MIGIIQVSKTHKVLVQENNLEKLNFVYTVSQQIWTDFTLHFNNNESSFKHLGDKLHKLTNINNITLHGKVDVLWDTCSL